MTTYTDVFGGANIYPSEISYSSLTLTADVTLSWPEETGGDAPFATRIMDIAASSAGRSITLPPANAAGVGETILFNNIGAQTITVRNAAGTQVVTVASGTLWQIYLAANSTAAGTWRALQYGASISQANASSLAGTGIVAVGTLLSQSVPITTFNNDYTAGTPDRARMFNWTGSTGTLTLPSAPVVGNNWFVYVRNSGTGEVVVEPSGLPTIDGESSLAFQPGESAIVACDGANYFTIGFGQSATFAFDYTVIDVEGGGDYVLSGTELNRIVYKFIGELDDDRDIIVPATVQQYWISNDTSGEYLLTVKTDGGTGVAIGQGERGIFYCDGTDVVDADTSTVSTPIAINQGGTGAITASAARINLGATSVGDALFTAADEAAAYAALGVAPAGVVDGGTF
jgi:hypothetical protein